MAPDSFVEHLHRKLFVIITEEDNAVQQFAVASLAASQCYPPWLTNIRKG